MSRGGYPLYQGPGSKLSGRLCPLSGMVVVFLHRNTRWSGVVTCHEIWMSVPSHNYHDMFYPTFFKSHLFYPIIIIPSHNIAMILWKVPGISKAILGENSIWQKAYVWDLEDYHLFRAEQRWFRYCAGHLQYAPVIRGNCHAGTLRHPERWYECVWK